jgi:hypothetical protein
MVAPSSNPLLSSSRERPALAQPEQEAFDDGERAANLAEVDRAIALARRAQFEILESQDIDENGVVRCVGCQEAEELRYFQATGRRRR